MTGNQRVLLIGPLPPPPTGQSIAFHMLVEGIVPRDMIDVVNLAERHGRRDASFSPRRAFGVLGAAARVWKLSRRVRVIYLQIAQSRWGFLRDVLFISIARWRGLSVVAHLHGGGYRDFYDGESSLMRSLIRYVLLKIDRVIVLSEALRENFAFMGPLYDQRLRVIANACPIPTGSPRKASNGTLRLLYLSNLLVEKGYLDCVDAIVHLNRVLGPGQVHLTLAGAPLLGADDYNSASDLLVTLKKHIRYLGVEDSVSVVGPVQGEAKLELLRDCDVALLPTYYRNEGQPIAIIEALASGLPVITTNWRGIGEILGNDQVGIVVPPRFSLAIADAIERIRRSPELYERMSANAVKRSGHYTRERHVAQILDVFDELSTAFIEAREAL